MRGNSEIIQGIKVLLAQGEQGSSISSIEKTSSSGAVDTYTITLTDGSTSTFEVTNGTPIQSIVLTSSDDVYDTYTITDAAGNTTTFSVRNHVNDMENFFNEINSLLENTPYLTAVENEAIELPVNTINDNVTSQDSTWSSEHILSLLDGVNEELGVLALANTEHAQQISSIQSQLSTIRNTVNTLNTASMYRTGEVFSCGDSCTYSGILYSSMTRLDVLIPLPKPVSSAVRGATLASGAAITVRDCDGNTLQATATIASIATMSVVSISQAGIVLAFDKLSGNWGGSRNGQTVNVVFNTTFRLTFT